MVRKVYGEGKERRRGRRISAGKDEVEVREEHVTLPTQLYLNAPAPAIFIEFSPSFWIGRIATRRRLRTPAIDLVAAPIYLV